jgi:hypothetical protein
VNAFSFLLALPLDPKPEIFMFQDKNVQFIVTIWKFE